MRTELIIQGIKDQLPSTKYRRHAVRRLIRDTFKKHTMTKHTITRKAHKIIEAARIQYIICCPSPERNH